jgi:hypothetical protein
MGLYRALYFTPYALTLEREHTTRYVEILIALAPAIGGLLIASSAYSPAALYSAAAILIALSLIPAFFIPVRYEGFAWRYRETFHELVARKHRKLLGIAFLDGIEATALLLLWPILVWTLVPFSRLGLIISITLLLGLCVRYYLQRAGWRPKPLHQALVEISASLLRITATGAVAVIAIDAYARSGADAGQRGIDIPTHEQMADNHTYLDEYSVLKDMGNGLGRIFLCLTIALMAQASFQAAVFVAFACAALASALSLYISRAHERTAF